MSGLDGSKTWRLGHTHEPSTWIIWRRPSRIIRRMAGELFSPVRGAIGQRAASGRLLCLDFRT